MGLREVSDSSPNVDKKRKKNYPSKKKPREASKVVEKNEKENRNKASTPSREFQFIVE